MTPDEIRVKMEKINRFILDSETAVRDGNMVDLAGLDKDVADICSQSVALPPEQGRDIQPLMADMIGNLERLSEALKDFKSGLGQ